MVNIYSSNNAIEANTIVSFLAEAGIDAEITGENASNMLGEKIEIWIRDDSAAQRAREIIKEALREASEEERKHMHDQQQGSSIWTGFFLGVLLMFILSSIAFALYKGSYLKRDYVNGRDTNNDGKEDAWQTFSDGRLIKWTADNNYDGKIDSWHYYIDGIIDRGEYDENYDGKVDSWSEYSSNGLIKESLRDLNGDGFPDYWRHYNNSILESYSTDNNFNGKEDEWGSIENGLYVESDISFKEDRIIDKRIIYKYGNKTQALLDTDRDGVFDKAVNYDDFGRETGTEKISVPSGRTP